MAIWLPAKIYNLCPLYTISLRQSKCLESKNQQTFSCRQNLTLTCQIYKVFFNSKSLLENHHLLKRRNLPGSFISLGLKSKPTRGRWGREEEGRAKGGQVFRDRRKFNLSRKHKKQYIYIYMYI